MGFFKEEALKCSSQQDPFGPLLTTVAYLFQGTRGSSFFLECVFIPLRKVAPRVCEKGGLTQQPWAQLSSWVHSLSVFTSLGVCLGPMCS